ncbi:hypothetical protein PHYSODRAFT_284043 [Phytophthora sojae]|uniref:RXLR phytopathogen effector protein WY-domain domain-containing protein n=2 Tax=Phytophthora sojae TaxID=67593 RepID=G4YGP8_PHYSP|nr:hypothetical protein PHYSODRAFT_284043 [Phytophthora sojae]AEK81091.1 Avh274a1 [Phytophthora sojae]AEK81092.1 Avh274a1 [Phytophthora sojae]AEK81093.1 Avh274a1 [Phytophthora sojae]EGZ27011.1 hypothetical protein PHYSODRAFT_284043 [Phytophthora sojae]|eukprot:XP_009514286.1 hypothetical protein PHYSODRAFT_284043 [Phytophthora sojae]
MGTLCILWLLVSIYSAGVNSSETSIRSKNALASDDSVRVLRVHESADVGNISNADEERVSSGAWVSRLAELDKKTSKFQKLDMQLAQKVWIYNGKNPKFMFKYLDIFNTWAKIDNSKRTIQWFRFTKAFRDKKGAGSSPNYDIYTLLRSKVPEDKLAITFESLKQIPDVRNLAETMQNYQLKLWIDQKETPTSIRRLLGIPHSTALKTERGRKDEILSTFIKMYNGGSKMTRSTTIV